MVGKEVLRVQLVSTLKTDLFIKKNREQPPTPPEVSAHFYFAASVRAVLVKETASLYLARCKEPCLSYIFHSRVKFWLPKSLLKAGITTVKPAKWKNTDSVLALTLNFS